MDKCDLCSKLREYNDKSCWSGCNTCYKAVCCTKCSSAIFSYYCKDCIKNDKTTPQQKQYMKNRPGYSRFI